MIISNGKVQFATASGGGIDEATGFATAVTVTWGDPVNCQWGYERQDLQARDAEGSPIKDTRRWILIDGAITMSERLKLTDLQGNALGEYPIIAMEYLRAVNQTRITI